MSEQHLGQISVNLYQLYETKTHETVAAKNKKVAEHITHMEKLQHFLSLVNERTKDSSRLDMSLAEDQALVDDLRAIPGTSHIFPHGKYEWKEKELEHLHEKVSQYIQGPLQRLINTGTEEMVLIQHELTKSLEIFNRNLQKMNGLNERIQSNIQRAHS